MKSLEIKLEAFEGPLVLLYKLIEKNKINIYDIPISKLTDQFIKYISTFPKDMESISEFLVMAATLIEIKSKMLLPKELNQEDKQQDPREELVRKLVEYKKFKGIAEILKEQAVFSEKILYKNPETQVFNMFSNSKSNDLKDTLENITLDKLFYLFQDILKRKEHKKYEIKSKSIFKDIYTVENKITHIQSLLKVYKTINFNDTFKASSSKTEIVVTFMAILELLKTRSIKIIQKSLFDEIIISIY